MCWTEIRGTYLSVYLVLVSLDVLTLQLHDTLVSAAESTVDVRPIVESRLDTTSKFLAVRPVLVLWDFLRTYFSTDSSIEVVTKALFQFAGGLEILRPERL